MEYLELKAVAEILKIKEETLKFWAKSKDGRGRNFRNYLTKIGRRNVMTQESLKAWMKPEATKK